jgi:nicotinamide-nucleotide amidase
MEQLIKDHGAVSEPVAAKMATGGQTVSGAHYVLSITGIAGPGGGTESKPIGTVCIGIAAGERVVTRQFLFPGDRDMIRDRAAKTALTMLRFELLGKPLPF